MAATFPVPSPSRESPSSPSGSATKEQRGDLQFPWKLHLLLEQAEKSGQDHIVSWLPDGKSFKIHNKTAFSEELMLSFFSSNKFKSFQRSLNLWGFETVLKGPNKGSRFHEHFVKGKPDLCQLMTRTKVKGRGGILPSSPVSPVAANRYQNAENHQAVVSSPSNANTRSTTTTTTSREAGIMESRPQQDHHHHRANINVSGIGATTTATTGNGAGTLFPPNFPLAAAMPLWGPSSGALSTLPKLSADQKQQQHLMFAGRGGVPAFAVNSAQSSFWSGGAVDASSLVLNQLEQQQGNKDAHIASLLKQHQQQQEEANSAIVMGQQQQQQQPQLERMLSVIRYLGISNNNIDLPAAAAAAYAAQQQQQQLQQLYFAGLAADAEQQQQQQQQQQRKAFDDLAAIRNQIAALERASGGGYNFNTVSHQQQQQYLQQNLGGIASALKPGGGATTPQLLDSAIMDMVTNQILGGQATTKSTAGETGAAGIHPI